MTGLNMDSQDKQDVITKSHSNGMTVLLVGRASHQTPTPLGGRNPNASHSVKGLRWKNTKLFDWNGS
jgi:hypothetical protein